MLHLRHYGLRTALWQNFNTRPIERQMPISLLAAFIINDSCVEDADSFEGVFSILNFKSGIFLYNVTLDCRLQRRGVGDTLRQPET